MKRFEVEIGRPINPGEEDIITVRVTADTNQTMGLTCSSRSGASMAGDLMGWTGSDETVEPRATAWTSPVDRYTVRISDPSSEHGEVTVVAESADGTAVSAQCGPSSTYRVAVRLLKELRGETFEPRKWSLSDPIPPRPWSPAEGTALADRKGGGWPDDEPFPLDPDECVALVKGMAVKPRRYFDVQMLMQLPGKWEMSDGWIWFYRT